MENGQMQAPGSDGGAGAPQAPVAPAAPAQPAQPAAAPTQPAAPAPAAPTQPAAPAMTPQEQADKAEDDEWEAAQKAVFPGLKSNNQKPKEGAKDEPAKPAEKPKEGEAPADPNAPKKSDEEQGAGDGTGAQSEDAKKDGDKPDDGNQPTDPGAAVREARATARELAQQRVAMVTDVTEKLYPNLPKTLTDIDGDPINGPEDVMRLINPDTGETFTEEEAYNWYLKANDQFKQQIATVNDYIEKVSDTMLAVKDEADYVGTKYGEWLKANPERREELWAEFSKSLKTDPKSGIIIEMPFSLKAYYDRVMPYEMRATEAAATPPAPTDTTQTTQTTVDPQAAERQRQQQRADRSDIYQPPAGSNAQEDKEAEEWGKAAETVFGDQLKNRK